MIVKTLQLNVAALFVAMATILAAVPGVRGQASLSATEQRLVMDGTTLAQQLLSVDASDQRGRALSLLALSLDPKYVPAIELVEKTKSEEAITEPRTSPTPGQYERLLVTAANAESNADMQLMYFLVVLVLNRDNADARIYAAEAKSQGRELNLAALFESNKRLTLSEDVAYARLLRPVYEQVTAERLENGAERLMPKLMELADIFKERARADEADESLAKDSLSLLNELAGLIKKRESSLDRLERSKDYKPALRANSPLYQQELRAGLERGRKNAISDWEMNLKKTRPMADGLYRRISANEEALDAKFSVRQTADVSDYPQVAERPPVDMMPPVDEPPVDRPPVQTAPPVMLTNVDSEVDQDWTTHTRENSGPAVDTSAMSTPVHLRNQVKQVALWLSSRTRTTGQLVDKIVADDQGDGRVVLYLTASKLYMAQEADTRYSLTKSLQGMWGQRVVTDRKVANQNLAYLYVLDEEGKVIGGSTTGRASSVWVKKSTP